jgi:hypothetical protein
MAVSPRASQRQATYPETLIYHSTTQSLNNNTETTITFDTTARDAEGMRVSGDDTQLACTRDGGLYRATALVQFATNSTGYRELRIRLNSSGTLVRMLVASSGASVQSVVQATTTTAMEVGDELEVRGRQTSGGALNVEYAELHVERIGLGV